MKILVYNRTKIASLKTTGALTLFILKAPLSIRGLVIEAKYILTERESGS